MAARAQVPRQRIPRPSGALVGAAAPWAQLPEDDRRAITVDEVRRVLAPGTRGPELDAFASTGRRVTPAELPQGGRAGPAAVLCLLLEREGEANVVLTRRSAHLRSHSGEVSFPGGRLQPGELPLQAALREANEEIGIDAGAVEVIGQLTPLTTVRSLALVHCFVAHFRGPAGEDFAFSLNPGEVEKVFWVPLARLASEGVYHEELWPPLEEPPLQVQARAGCRPASSEPASSEPASSQPASSEPASGQPASGQPASGQPAHSGPTSSEPTPQGSSSYRAVPFFRLDEDIVWGATGRLLTELLATVLARRTSSELERRSGLSDRYPGGT
jgi:8-oxo-dGTP pyrophosphatase MutT (NUDIX family)